MEKNSAKGIIYLLITAIIWGGSFISQLFGGVTIGSFAFSGYRGIFGCITIAILIIYDNVKNHHSLTFFRKEEDIKSTVIGSCWCGVVLFSALITQQIGVEITDTAKSGIIASTEVIMVPIMMFLFFKRKIKFITWIFILTTMFGIMMLSMNSLSGINEGDIWVFISTILYSYTIIQVPKYINHIDSLKFSFFRFLMVMILGFLLSFIFKEDGVNVMKFKEALPSILYSGILASGVAYTLQVIGQKHCEPIVATLIMSLEGVFAAIFGWMILGQSLNLMQILGIIIAFISIIFVQITDNQVEAFS